MPKKHISTDKGAVAPTMSPFHSTENSPSFKRSVKCNGFATFGDAIWIQKMLGISTDKSPPTDKPPPQIVFSTDKRVSYPRRAPVLWAPNHFSRLAARTVCKTPETEKKNSSIFYQKILLRISPTDKSPPIMKAHAVQGVLQRQKSLFFI